MPTNVTVEYAQAEKRYQEARTPEEQLAALLEMQRTAPDHKGAEKLRAEISKKIKKTREKIEKNEEQRKKASARSTAIKKEGIGQIVLVGMPNSGKSTILKALTNVEVEIADYPFTTKTPQVGMIDFMNARIQLVEIPPIIEGSCSGKAMGRELFGLIRNSDAVALVLNASTLCSEFLTLKKEFANAEIELNAEKNPLSIEKSKFLGISIVNPAFYKEDLNELKAFLRKRGLSNVTIVFHRNAVLRDVETLLSSKTVNKRAMAIIVEKNGFKASQEDIEMVAKEMDFLQVNSLDEKQKNELVDKFFAMLERVLVFTKKPGEKQADKPMALPLGSTVGDAARCLHQDFEKNFKYARVWGSSKYPGQRVARDFVLKTGDIVEIYC
ncbi:MAG: GTPase [Candidatus Diapherotrites archaeon]